MATYNTPTDVSAGSLAKSSDLNNLDAAVAAAFALLPENAKINTGNVNFGVDTGTVNVYAIALPMTALAYTDGMSVVMRPLHNNTGACSINVDGLGAVAIKNTASEDPAPNDITVGIPIEVRYSVATGYFHMIQLSAVAAASATVSAAAALVSQLAAAASSLAASSSASAAAASQSAAAGSQSTASSAASGALVSESSASASALSASSSASAALVSQNAASSSETNASIHAGTATTQAGLAAGSAVDAANSAASASASYDNFDDRYLGAKAADPTLDNDGNALLTGAIYFNTVSNTMKAYTGAVWVPVVLTTPIAVDAGGTGRLTGTSAYALIATGTTAAGVQQSLAVGATTEILVGGGSSALPVWTTATGSGAPVRGTAPTITGGSISALTALSLRDTSAAKDVTIVATSSAALTDNRTLTIDMANGSKTVALGGSTYSFAGSFSTLGSYAITLTATGGTSITLPTSGTLVRGVTATNGVSAVNTAGDLAITLGNIAPSSVNGITAASGTNTFSLTRGTASIDLAAGAVVDINANLTVSATATVSGSNTGDVAKASGSEINTGTDDTKYTTAKAIFDSRIKEWRVVPAASFTATPASTSTITMGVNLTASILVGMALEYVIGGVTYYGQVSAIASNLLTVRGAPLSGDVTALSYGGGTVSEIVIAVRGLYEDADNSTLVLTDNQSQILWEKQTSYMVAFKAYTISHDSGGTHGAVTPMVNGAAVGTSNSNTGVLLAADGTWYGSVVDINTTNYIITPSSPIDIKVTKGTAGDASALTLIAIIVTP